MLLGCTLRFTTNEPEPCGDEPSCLLQAREERERYRRCRNDTAGDCREEHKRYVSTQARAESFAKARRDQDQAIRQAIAERRKRETEEAEARQREHEALEAARRAELAEAEAQRKAEARQQAIDGLSLEEFELRLRLCHSSQRHDCEQIVAIANESQTLSDEEKAKLERRAAEFRKKRDTPRRMMLCRDGTTSPSCECGGPRRGCCSHHGGVSGCE